MYITQDGYTYYDGSGQRHTRAPFLLLVQPKDEPAGKTNNLRGIVRKVALRQLGCWMMGVARVRGESITVSGAYGGDGLPCSVSRNVYDAGVPLPDALYEAWAHGGGWNSAGSEAQAMREWAQSIMG